MDSIKGFENLKKFIEDYTKLDGTKLNLEEFIQRTSCNSKAINSILVIDRIEDDYAVCEDRGTKEIIDIDLSSLPEDIAEGDVIKFINGRYQVDKEEQMRIENRIRNKMDKLWE